MTEFSSRQFPILFRKFRNVKGLASAIKEIDLDSLCSEYEMLESLAPNRHDRGMRYFVGHRGVVNTNSPINLSEKHLAIALWRQCELPSQDGASRLRLLDYEFPLKAAQSDAGLGKVDLLGVTTDGRLSIIELKVKPRNGARGDTPVHALMEGLRYAAVVQANMFAIRTEVKDSFGIVISDRAPIVQILALEGWWSGWRDMDQSTRLKAGNWESHCADLASRLEGRLGVTVECASLTDLGLTDIKWDAGQPRLPRLQFLTPVALHP